MSGAGVNVCSRILDACRRHPDRLALAVPRLDSDVTDRLSYGELLQQAGARQVALRDLGLKTGDRVLLLARPGLSLYVLMVALLAAGIVPVLVDRGMTRARLVSALRASGARVAIGERAILRFWWLFPVLWRWRRFAIDGSTLGVRALPAVDARPAQAFECVSLPTSAHGLITFTSGSTGAPKGADRSHGSLVEQHLAIRSHWQDREDDIDMPCFPVLVLHNLCCGISTVMPAVDLATPGQPDAARVLAQLRAQGVTRLSGAPAFIGKLVAQAEASGWHYDGLRSLVLGGATLPPGLAERCQRVFPQAEGRIVYGSTEAEPIAEVFFSEYIADGEQAPGHLLGQPAPVAQVCLVDPALALATEADVGRARLPVGQSGELLVAGPHVLRGYVDNPEADRESKIPRADGLVWHRTGDVAQFDARGRLWLQGRLKDAVTVEGGKRYTLALEKAVDALGGVTRCALVQVGEGRPALVIEGQAPGAALLRELLVRHGMPHATLWLVDTLPVDGRHNSKIDRPALREWLARGRLRAVGEV